MADKHPTYFEINALVDAIGKAIGLPGAVVARAVEKGEIGVDMATDALGRRCLKVTYQGRSATISQDAIPQSPNISVKRS